MQTQRIFTIEKSFLHRCFQRKASFIYHGKLRYSFSHLKFKTQMHFWDSENVIFGKFEGQKTAFRSENTGAKAQPKKQKSLNGNLQRSIESDQSAICRLARPGVIELTGLTTLNIFALGRFQKNRYHCAMRLLLFLPILLLPGCSGLGSYQVGSRSLFGSDIKTVYVPVVEADPTRRHLAERLTEAISKRIEERSPYKVVGRPSADSVLECRIISKNQWVSLVDENNDPRQKSGELSLEVRWRDRRSQDIRQFDVISWNEGTTHVTASDSMVAEFGHSLSTSEQKQIDRLASQIVGMMESPW